jgi:peptidoglycan/LPS O-acetylase OafA/YrhL
MLEGQRTLRLGGRRRFSEIGTIFLLVGLIVLLLPVIANYYEFDKTGPPDLRPWIPFLLLLVLWGIGFIVLSRRGRRWLRRELETLAALEKENQ